MRSVGCSSQPWSFDGWGQNLACPCYSPSLVHEAELVNFLGSVGEIYKDVKHGGIQFNSF